MSVGSSWSEQFVRQLDEHETRHAYMADQVRTQIALQIKALREQVERRWSQAELGRRAGKPQNVISRLENPDYGHLTLQTLFDMAEAFDLPLYIDFQEWEDWLYRMNDIDVRSLERRSFNLDRLIRLAATSSSLSSTAARAAAEAAKEASDQTTQWSDVYVKVVAAEAAKEALDQTTRRSVLPQWAVTRFDSERQEAAAMRNLGERHLGQTPADLGPNLLAA